MKKTEIYLTGSMFGFKISVIIGISEQFETSLTKNCIRASFILSESSSGWKDTKLSLQKIKKYGFFFRNELTDGSHILILIAVSRFST